MVCENGIKNEQMIQNREAQGIGALRVGTILKKNETILAFL
jgi:hypothetical protein